MLMNTFKGQENLKSTLCGTHVAHATFLHDYCDVQLILDFESQFEKLFIAIL